MSAVLSPLDLHLSGLKIPFSPVPASCGVTGFPSPADDYLAKKLSLEQLLNLKDTTTCYFKADGNSMEGIGVYHDDILVVDTSRKPTLGDLCICRIEGEFVAKIVEVQGGKPCLISANPKYPPCFVEEVEVFGVITSKITRYMGKSLLGRPLS